jgi:hypothetical protein
MSKPTSNTKLPEHFEVELFYAPKLQDILPGATWSMRDDVHAYCIRVQVRAADGRKAEVAINVNELMLAKDPIHVIGERLLMAAKDLATEEWNIRAELNRYKEAVKKLSFDLEMATTGQAVVRVEEVRKLALEQAAEFVMDHGVPHSGEELEQLCAQIKKLPMHKDARL